MSTQSISAVVDATHASALAAAGGLKLVERTLFLLERTGVQEANLITSQACRNSFESLRIPAGLDLKVFAADTLPAMPPHKRVLLVAAHLVLSLSALRYFLDSAATAEAMQASAGNVALPLVICPGSLMDNRLGGLSETRLFPIDGEGRVAMVADSRKRLRAAENALLASLGRPDDGIFTRLVDRRISQALTRRLAPTRVSPSAVTALSIATGLAAGLLLALGGYSASVCGTALFLASTILDGCDGELARLKFQESRTGALLDIAGDNLVHIAVFGGLAAGIYRQYPDLPLKTAGAVLLIGLFTAMATAYWCIFKQQPTSAQRALFDAFASREFAYLMFLCAAADRLLWFFWLAVGGTYMFAAGLLLLGTAWPTKRGDT